MPVSSATLSVARIKGCATHVVSGVLLCVLSATNAQSQPANSFGPIFKSDTDINTTLLMSAYRGDLDGVRHALSIGANANAKQSKELPFSEESAVCLAIDGTHQQNPISTASLQIVKLLFARRAAVGSCISLWLVVTSTLRSNK
jgi:hypothetical protein